MKVYKLIIIIILFISSAKGQNLVSFDVCKDLFDNQEFLRIIPSLKAYVSNNPELSGKDRYLCHYMLGISLFKTKSCSQGEKVFDFLDDCWYLPEDTRIRFRNELISCINNIASASEYKTKDIIEQQGPGQIIGAGVHSKQINIDFDVYSNSVGLSKTEFLSKISMSDFKNRISNKDIPVKFQNTGNYHFNSEHFILYGDKSKNEVDLKIISNELEGALKFFYSFFNFQQMPEYINVYVISNAYDIIQFANGFHSLKLAENTIGYMFPYDNSIVGYLPDNYAGTLKHELMHLLLFNNIQPSPPWLDEGLAALYEVSTLKGGMLYGLDNWRGKLLRENWSYIDQRWRQNDIGSIFSIPDIISKYTWKATNYTDDDHIADQVLINAISRYFFLYLQEKGTLSDFVISIRNYNVNSPDDFYLQKLKDTTHKFPEEFDREFKVWLRQRVFSTE